MKFKNIRFLKSCTAKDQFPDYPYPEFAFIGRSNVGKSSLINMLLGQKNLVKTGSKPGVTKTINFFVIDDNMSFTDLPGFGYAKLPMEIKKTFYPLIKSYISSRKNLKLAFLLIDIRRTPDEYEKDILTMLVKKEIYVAIALTKCDKVTRGKKIESGKNICEFLGIDSESVFFTSSKTSEGKRELLGLVSQYRSNRQ